MKGVFFLNPDELRRLIREELPTGIQQMAAIIRDPNSSDRNRIEAFKTLADRGGVPEVKAAVTQNINAKLTVEELEEQRAGLLQEQKQLSCELKELKAGGLEDAKERQNKILPRPESKKEAK